MRRSVFIPAVVIALAVSTFACDDGGGGEATPTAPAVETPSPTIPSQPPATIPAEDVPPEANDAFAAVRLDLRARFGRAADELDLLSIEAMDWPDACLGLAEEGEVCAQVITPGYRIVVGAPEGEPYVYRTDTSGGAVRLETMPRDGG